MKKYLILFWCCMSFSVHAMSDSTPVRVSNVGQQRNVFLSGVHATRTLQSRGTITTTSEARWLRWLCGSVTSGLKDMVGCVKRNPRKTIGFLGVLGVSGIGFCCWRLYKKWTAPLDEKIDAAQKKAEELNNGIDAAGSQADRNGMLANGLLQQGEQNSLLAGQLGRGAQGILQGVEQNGQLVAGLSSLNQDADNLLKEERKSGEQNVEKIKRLSASVENLSSQTQMQDLVGGVGQFGQAVGDQLALTDGGSGGATPQSKKRK